MVRHSFIEFVGASERGSCGYCKGAKQRHSLGEGPQDEDSGSVCLGAVAFRLSVHHYNSYLEWGWSRSGAYLYKPTMDKTCCPQYTIRLDVHRFQISRTQKRVLREMGDFLKTGAKPREVKEVAAAVVEMPAQEKMDRKEKGEIVGKGERTEKKKEKRRQRAIERWREKGEDVEEKQKQRKEKEMARQRNLGERIGRGWQEGDAHQLEVEIVEVGSEEFTERADESFALFEKYQTVVHKDERVSRSGYERFLVRTPIVTSESCLGSFHHRYVLDGKLVAVGVVDVLPRCLSSKYLFYDPDYSFLSLGTYTALREIDMVRRLSGVMPELHFYYMGYYIVSCPKMRYKGRFRPSQLLCDNSLQWCELEECHSLLAANNNEFTLFFPSSPRAPRLDPLRATVLYKRDIVRAASLAPEDLERVLPKMREMASALGEDHDDIVLIFRELCVDGGESDEDESAEQ